MAADDPQVIEVAEAIADGVAVDWSTVHDSADPQDAAHPKRELEIIAALAAVHRQFSASGEGGSLGDVLSGTTTGGLPVPSAMNGVPWGPLLVLDRVGGGSFGTVFRAWDPTLEHEVALKRLRLPAEAPRSQIASVVREGQLLARVRHENVITVHGACEIDGEVGIWMEFVRGKTLERIIRDDGPLSAQEATVVGESLCRALAAVHQADLLHRDIKASNVMREAGGRIVMLDFGAGTEASVEIAGEARRLVGTPLYMAPELFNGATASKRSDIYSLGVLLFYLVTGRYPVEGKSLAQIRSAHEAGSRHLLSDTRVNLPRNFVKVVERAQSPQPQNRYASVGEMLRDLDVEPQPVRSVRPIVAVVIAVLLFASFGFYLVGLLTTLTFNVSVGRVAGFGDEPILALWGYGQRALIPPSFVLIVAGLFLVAIQPVCRFILRWPVAVTRRVPWINRTCQAAAASTRSDINGVAQLLLVVQLSVGAFLCWRFSAILRAVTQHLSDAPYEALAPLSPDVFKADERALFVIYVCMAMLGMIVGWATLLRNRPPGAGNVSPITLAGGVTVTTLLLLILVMPWRIMYSNKHERVEFDSARCYVVGERRSDILLYCPDVSPPKTRIVPAADSRIRRSHVLESIFTPPKSPPAT